MGTESRLSNGQKTGWRETKRYRCKPIKTAVFDKEAAQTLIRETIKPEIYENGDGIDRFHACKMLERSGDKVAEAFEDKKMKSWMKQYSKNQKERNVVEQ